MAPGFRLVLVITSVLLVATTAACRSERREDDESLASRSSALLLSQGDRELANVASEFQRPLLEDGELTFPEYERAIFATVDCVEGQGLKVNGPVLTAMDTYYFEVSGDRDPTAALQACEEQYSSLVSRLWQTNAKAPESLLQEARDALSRCLRDKGVEGLPEQPGPGEISRVLLGPGDSAPEHGAAILQCSQEVGAEYGLPNFGG